MEETKKDVISFANDSSATESHAFCEIIDDYLKKEAESEFFKQMDITEESIKNEGTVTSAELRASLGIYKKRIYYVEKSQDT